MKHLLRSFGHKLNFYILALTVAWSTVFSVESRGAFEWTHFRVAQYSTFQASAIFNSSYTASLAWAPEMSLNQTFSLVTLLEGMPVLKANGLVPFPVVEASIHLSTHLGQWKFDGGPGFQLWFDPLATIPSALLGTTVRYQFSQKVFSFIDGFYVGYAYVLQFPRVHETRLGISCSF